MPSNIEMTVEGKKASAEALAKVLADTYVLYLKTHAFHWNVEGRSFRTLHELFEEQYRDLWESTDEIAERIRALGEYAPGTYTKFQSLASIRENDGVPNSDEMLRELIADNETTVKTIRSALFTAEDHGDEATVDLLTGRLTAHEKQIWMMKSILK